MKPLIVKEQAELGLQRVFSLSLSGMRYRLFRSLVTIGILALAVMFLCHTLAHSLIVANVQAAAYHELADVRELGVWTRRLTLPDSGQTIQRAMAENDGPRVREYSTWGGLTAAELATARQTAERLQAFESRLAELPAAARAVVLGDESEHTLTRKLAEPKRAERLFEQFKQLGQPLHEPQEQIATLLLTDQPQLTAVLARIEAGQARAIENLRSQMAGTPVVRWLAQDATAIHTPLTTLGFELTPSDAGALARAAKVQVDRDAISAVLGQEQVVSGLIRLTDLPREQIALGEVLRVIGSQRAAAELAEVINPRLATPLTAERFLELARRSQREAKLRDAAPAEAPRQSTWAMPATLWWLIGLSSLVCLVGVCNAMFMSVSERFSEIATMKCLGALDTFLMKLFLFESGIQGLIGAILGILFGVLLAIVRGTVSFGGLVFENLPVLALLVAGVASLVMGIVLAVVAAVGPAAAAARLAPMEAMRID